MATPCLCLLFLAILSLNVVVSVDPPTPTPAPESGADDLSPPPLGTGAPFSSPPSPDAPSPDTEDSPYSSPAPSPDSVPVPAPTESDVGHIEVDDQDPEGLGGGKKAGIAVGVIAAVGFVAGAGCVLKKRRENERRAQYGYAMRRDFL